MIVSLGTALNNGQNKDASSQWNDTNKSFNTHTRNLLPGASAVPKFT